VCDSSRRLLLTQEAQTSQMENFSLLAWKMEIKVVSSPEDYESKCDEKCNIYIYIYIYSGWTYKY
jgi:hypothetical protein